MGTYRSRKIELTTKQKTKFWMKVFDETKGINDCWEWQGCVFSKEQPYGKFHSFKAHRVAYHLTYGLKHELDSMYCVKHTCNNKRCCNPFHLVEATIQSNNIDAIDDDLINNGVKLNKQQATEILYLLTYHYEKKLPTILAEIYQVSRKNIMLIKKRSIWKNIRIPAEF